MISLVVNRENVFGEVEKEGEVSSDLGEAVDRVWEMSAPTTELCAAPGFDQETFEPGLVGEKETNEVADRFLASGRCFSPTVKFS